MTEAQLQAQILAALRQVPGLLVWRNAIGSRGGVQLGLGRGSADIIGLLAPHGRFIALEVKLPKGKVTSEQERWADRVWDVGGRASVVRSVHDALYFVQKWIASDLGAAATSSPQRGEIEKVSSHFPASPPRARGRTA